MARIGTGRRWTNIYGTPRLDYAGYQVAARQPSVGESEKQPLAVIHFRCQVYSAKGKAIHSERFGVPLLISLSSRYQCGTLEVYNQILFQAQHFLINIPPITVNAEERKSVIKGNGVFHLDLSHYERNGYDAVNHLNATWKLDGIKKHWNGVMYDKHVSMGVPPGRVWGPTVERVEVVKEEVKECVVCMNAVADTAFLHKYVSSNG